MFNVEVYDEYKFYYDESNNMRVFSLRDGKYNIDSDPVQKVSPVFVLAGIALRKDQGRLDFVSLQESLRLQKTASELKFKSIVRLKANFTPHQAFRFVLGNRTVNNILSWLAKNDVAIHCFSVNAAYWSSLDIIEDLLCFDPSSEELIDQHYYKDCLYSLIKLDKTGFINILNEFGYPRIDKGQALPFLKALYELIQENMAKCFPGHSDKGEADDDFSRMARLGLLVYKRLMRNSDELEFNLVHDIDEGILIGDFSFFYCNRISTFPKSKHFLDDEDKIEPLIDGKFSILGRSESYDYVFLNSKDNLQIQVADAVAGIFRVLLVFLESASLEEVKLFVKGLSAMEESTFKKFKMLLEKSIDECGMLFHAVMVPADLEKYKLLFNDQLRRHYRFSAR